MKISIVTISYNQVSFLKKCINSVLSQKNVDLEYIIVDPGSNDGSRELIESFGNSVVPVFKKDDGPADGLNNGFSVATGDIFCFINADDYFLPLSLYTIEEHFRNSDMDHFVSGGGFTESDSMGRSAVFPTRMTVRGLLYNACTIFQQGTFFPAKLFRLAGGFNKKNYTCWDLELFLKFVALGYDHKIIKSNLAVFCIHQDSITGSGRLRDKYLRDRERIFEQTTGRSWSTLDTAISFGLRAVKKIKNVAR